MEYKGRVIKSTGSSYMVSSPVTGSIECIITGKYRLEELRSTNPVVVGDWVKFTLQERGNVGETILSEGLPSCLNHIRSLLPTSTR